MTDIEERTFKWYPDCPAILKEMKGHVLDDFRIERGDSSFGSFYRAYLGADCVCERRTKTDLRQHLKTLLKKGEGKGNDKR